MAKPTYVTDFIRYYEKIAPRAMGFLTFFRSDESTITDAPQIEFDRRKSRLIISKAKNRGSEPTNNSNGNFERVTVIPPIYKECKNFAIQEKDVFGFGQNPYDISEDRQMRLLREAAKDIILLDEKMNGAEAWQAAQIFQTGKIAFSTAGYSEGKPDIDFGCPEAHFATLTNTTGTLYWDNASATPIANLEAHCKIIRNSGHSTVRDIVFGSSAWSNFVKNESVQKQFDIRRMEFGFIRPTEEREGLCFMGRLHLDGAMVNLWTCDATYISPADDSTSQDLMDPKKVVFIADGDYEKWYAGVDVIKGIATPNFDAMLSQYMRADGSITVIGDRVATRLYVDTYIDHGVAVIRAQKAPLCIPKSNDTFGCLKVLS